MMSPARYATTVNCIDGRAQQPVADWLKSNYGVDYVDAVTEPGPSRNLICGAPAQVEAIRHRACVSVGAHASAIVALAAHGDCAGNPASKEESIRQTREALNVIQSWGLPVTLIGLWVDGETWQGERVAGIRSGNDSAKNTK
jgi:hypothetical protein